MSVTTSSFVFLTEAKDINYSERLTRVNFASFFEMAGIATYSIEGIGLLFPLRFDYLRYNNYKQFRCSYFVVLVLTVLIYFVFALANYLRFFDTTGEIIFYNYDSTHKFLYGLEVSYLLVV